MILTSFAGFRFDEWLVLAGLLILFLGGVKLVKTQRNDIDDFKRGGK
jgi:hypothetical protein